MSGDWLNRRVLGYAHQGGALEAPASTLFAIEKAVSIGIKAVELDLHLSRDGVVVVNHDDVVDACTNGTGRVSDLNFQEIAELDAGYRFVGDDGTFPYRGMRASIPELRLVRIEELLERYPDLIWNFDLKEDYGPDSALEPLVSGLIRRYEVEENTIVASFHQAPLDRFRSLDPELSTAASPDEAYGFYASFQQNEGEPLDSPPFVALQVPARLAGAKYLSRDLLEYAHRSGLAVHVWTVDDVNTIEELVAIGCDGIISDRPSLLQSKLDDLGVLYR